MLLELVTQIVGDVSTEDEVFEFWTTDESAGSDVLGGYPSSSVLPFIEEVILNVVVFCVILSLNLIIVRCYWKETSLISVYIRWFACIDVILVKFFMIMRMSILMYDGMLVVTIFYKLMNTVGSSYMLGPLFLALDRALMVVFPLNADLHWSKMRLFKVVLVLMCLVPNLLSLFVSGGFVVVLIYFAMANSVLQLVSCVGLYLFIFIKVVRADRSMKESRHDGTE